MNATSNTKPTLASEVGADKELSVSARALRQAMDARIATMLVGEPGTTKTANIRSIAKELGYDVVSVIASRMEPQDISGFPSTGEVEWEDANGNVTTHPVTRYLPQSWQVEVMKKKKVIVFLDEFSNATPPTRASLLTVIQDRQFPNGDLFPEETIIVGAMNPVSQSPDGYELDPATANRMLFIPWDPAPSEWLDGFPTNWGEPMKGQHESEWRGLITRYIDENRGSLHTFDQTSDQASEAFGVNVNSEVEKTVASYAWASRRSWDNLAVALGVATLPGRVDMTADMVMRGLIGARAATNFVEWLAKNGVLDVRRILANPRDEKIDWEKMSVSDVVTVARASLDEFSDDTWQAAIDVFDMVATHRKGGADLASLIQPLASKTRTLNDPKARAAFRKAVTELLAKYQKVVAAAS